MTEILAFLIYLWVHSIPVHIEEPMTVAEEPYEEFIDIYDKEVPEYHVVYMDVSAYTPHDSGSLTASGHIPIEGVTVAMNDVPLGTIIEIDGKQYEVQDRCGMDRIDIFMESYHQAIEWGVRHKEIKVYDD